MTRGHETVVVPSDRVAVRLKLRNACTCADSGPPTGRALVERKRPVGLFRPFQHSPQPGNGQVPAGGRWPHGRRLVAPMRCLSRRWRAWRVAPSLHSRSRASAHRPAGAQPADRAAGASGRGRAVRAFAARRDVTEPGSALLARVAAAVQAIDAGVEEAQHVAAGRGGVLRVGFGRSCCPSRSTFSGFRELGRSHQVDGPARTLGR